MIRSLTFFLGSTAFLAVLFTSCVTDDEKRKVVEQEQVVLPFEVTKDAVILYSDSGTVKMKIISPEIQRFAGEEPYSEFPKGVRVEFYKKNGEIKSYMESGYAINMEGDDVMEARHNVKVLNPDGDRLNTEKLIWNKKTKKIHTDEPVQITTEEEVIFGKGLIAEQDFSKYQIKDITGVINIEDEQGQQTE